MDADYSDINVCCSRPVCFGCNRGSLCLEWRPDGVNDLECLCSQDIVTRYASSTGHHVSRRFGWDCHGLPVEYEIDKSFGV